MAAAVGEIAGGVENGALLAWCSDCGATRIVSTRAVLNAWAYAHRKAAADLELLSRCVRCVASGEAIRERPQAVLCHSSREIPACFNTVSSRSTPISPR